VSRGWHNGTSSRQWDTRVGTIELAVLRVGEVDVTDPASLAKPIGELEKQIKVAARRLEFEEAMQLCDRIKKLRPSRSTRRS
jgi:excinuclease UvrABC helicase subunit UvrB